MTQSEPTEYTLDALNEVVDQYGIAREELEDADDGELIGLVEELSANMGELKHDEFAVFSTAKGILFERGYECRSTGEGAVVEGGAS